MQAQIVVLRRTSKRWLRLAAAITLMVWLFGLAACAGLPKDYPRSESTAFKPSSEGILARLVEKIAEQYGENISGFLLLNRNDAALNWRLLLADLAQQSLDIQVSV